MVVSPSRRMMSQALLMALRSSSRVNIVYLTSFVSRWEPSKSSVGFFYTLLHPFGYSENSLDRLIV